MNRLTRCIVAGLLLLALSASAQSPLASAPSDSEARLAEFSKELDLSTEQKAKVAPILLENGAAARDIRDKITSGDLRRFQGVRELRKLGDQMEKELEPILTPEQMEKVKARREARRQQLRERLKERSGS